MITVKSSVAATSVRGGELKGVHVPCNSSADDDEMALQRWRRQEGGLREGGDTAMGGWRPKRMDVEKGVVRLDNIWVMGLES
ncbi:hypothetical protein SESBI_29768 [Sesbania bispinosa]|nr:hypothetical protein SESBI_29768 [Sesbania bispinosa]